MAISEKKSASNFSDTRTVPEYNEEKAKRWPWLIDNTEIKNYDPNFNWPKISIVTPSFNQGEYIEETIRSVIFQNYPNLEYIIIDGGSSDSTLSIIKKYESYITYWESEPDRGQSHAINKGLEKCTGEIFNWLNSDDFYLPDTFFNVATAFIDNLSINIVSGFENHIELNDSITKHNGTFLANTLEETIELCEITQPSTFFRLSAINQIGTLPEDIHYIMDGEIWVRLLLAYGTKSFLKLAKPLANFRLHEGSKTVSNLAVDNFLVERSSIIAALQRHIKVPGKIINYYLQELYKTEKYHVLERNWKIDRKVITVRRLKIYFIRKYINSQFQKNNIRDAFWGLKMLVKNLSFDFFTLKSFLKLLVKISCK
jgi:glycosyltransferase involved in cell wall biosynthesis